MARVDDQAILRAYRLGLREGAEEAAPFHGRTTLLAFPKRQPVYAAVVAYERQLIEQLPHVEQALKLAADQLEQAVAAHAEAEADRAAHGGTRPLARHLVARLRWFVRSREATRYIESCRRAIDEEQSRSKAAAADDEWLQAEILAVRDWLDAFVSAAERYFDDRATLRRTPKAEIRPLSVRRYSSAQEFLNDDHRRGINGRPGELGGADFGCEWSWQDADRPWIITQWRVSIIDATHEIYAIQLMPQDSGQFAWRAPRHPIDRPVWLLHDHFLLDRGRSFPLWRESAEWRALGELQARLMKSRNSLIALAEALAVIDVTSQKESADDHDVAETASALEEDGED